MAENNYDLDYTGSMVDRILDTGYDLQNQGYIFRGLASHYTGTPTERTWLIAPTGSTGFGLSSPVPPGSIGICMYNGSSWYAEVLNTLTLDTAPTTGSGNGITSGAVKTLAESITNAIGQLEQSVSDRFTSLELEDTTGSLQAEVLSITLKYVFEGETEALTSLSILAATAEKAGLMSAADKRKLDAFVTNIRSLRIQDTTAQADQGTEITNTLSWTIEGVTEAITAFTLYAATTSKAGLMSAADKTALDTLPSLINAGYLYAGIATPSTVPSSTSAKIYYIAIEGGTYTGFNLNVTQGINIIYKSGDAWSVAQVVGIDNEPTAGSDNLVKSGGVKTELALGAVYDVSAHNNGATFESLSALLSDTDLNALIPTAVRKGGMSIKFVQSSDNKYVQYFLTKDEWSASEADWEKINLEEEVSQLAQEIKDSTGEIREVTLSDTNVNVFKVDIKQGGGFYLRITGNFTRVIINYNGSNSNRLVDSNVVTVESGKWYYTLAPVDLTQLGLWYSNDGTDISFAIRMFDKSYLESAPELFGVLNMTENTSVKKQSINLFDFSARSQNSLLDSDGTIFDSTTYYTSEYIPVYKNKTYSFRGYIRRIALYDSYHRLVQYVETAGANYQFTPTKDGFLRFSAVNTLTDAVLIEGAVTPQEYIPYKEKIQENVFLSETLKGEIKELVSGEDGGLLLELSNPSLVFKNGLNQVRATLNLAESSGTQYDENPVFNFVDYTYNGHTLVTDDDVAPLHIFGTTLGANHGQPCQKLTIASHGLTNADVGKYLLDNTGKYYIVRVVDSNNIWTLGENTSSDPTEPVFRTLEGQTATLTLDGNTYNVTSITSAQIRPFVKNVSHHIYDNLGHEITTNGSYHAKYFDVVEQYDIMYSPSVLANLINSVGTTTDPVYDGDSALTVKNTYRFLPNLSVLVFATIIPRMNIKFADAMFSQAVRIGGITSTKYYLPGSVPGNSYDLTRPLTVPFGSSYPGINVSKNEYWPDASSPVDRVLQFTTEHGFAIGIIPTLGVGKDIIAYTDQTFEIRGSSGKIYPHPVSGAVVGNLSVGKIYNSAIFRAFIPNETMDGNTIGIYGYELDDNYYLYAEFSNTIIKDIPVDKKYNGRDVEVVKAINCELLTDICNNGIIVQANSVSGETSCIVLKL